MIIRSYSSNGPVPCGFAKTERTNYYIDDKHKIIYLPKTPTYLFSVKLWSHHGERYDINADERVNGKWRLIVRLRWTPGEGFSVRKGWALEKDRV